VYDDEREEFLLLDVNTRPWKWIGMPVAAGANLPMAAYAAVTDAEYESSGVEPTRWVYLRDYLARCSRATTCSGTSCRPPTGGGSSPATSSARGT